MFLMIKLWIFASRPLCTMTVSKQKFIILYWVVLKYGVGHVYSVTESKKYSNSDILTVFIVNGKTPYIMTIKIN